MLTFKRFKVWKNASKTVFKLRYLQYKITPAQYFKSLGLGINLNTLIHTTYIHFSISYGQHMIPFLNAHALLFVSARVILVRQRSQRLFGDTLKTNKNYGSVLQWMTKLNVSHRDHKNITLYIKNMHRFKILHKVYELEKTSKHLYDLGEF